MRLLLDQNLSHRLCDNLSDIWTELVHVRTLGLSAADDTVIWDHALRHGFTIVSKDSNQLLRPRELAQVAQRCQGT